MDVFEDLDILGFPNYKLSRNGTILNKTTGKTFSGSNCETYTTAGIINSEGKFKSCMLHILVAKMFVPNPDNKPIVNHIDENKHNPSADNLEWVTYKENSNHGTSRDRISEHNAFPVNQYDLQGKYIRTWKNPKFAAKYYCVQPRTIQKYAKIDKGATCGSLWKYYNDETSDLDLDYEIVITRGTKKYKTDKPIPNDYLFKFETENDKCTRIFEQLLENVKITINQKKDIEFLKKYINDLKSDSLNNVV